ncbi:aldo/keto reductase [Spiroplasma taiwanense]|uniref:Aldo/keto reductase n=1 Tax=Spiroplasma taiwanense CT-1 TaxID=1276220 RepID=S5LZN8_9MOLU|nr:aldo/keto reductase [Spiroplasma taiwanense]AGR41167.1 aldo/keto reductase [Spiroplasma taiwanense CT-1]
MKKILQKTLKFNNGLEIPQIGLGTYKLEDENETLQSVKAAIENGYRHIDTASIYHNHKIIAQAIKESKIDRKKLFITSKIWNSHHEYNLAKIAVDEILAELELEYIDLLLIHWPTENRLGCWKALEEAVDQGKVKSIGISNFQPHHIEELLKNCRIKPVINQFELHPALQNLEVVKICRDNDIIVESWGTMIRGKCFEIEQIQQLASKYNKTEAQICLRWGFQNDYVIIPKSSKPKRVIENIDIEDFELTAEDMKILATITEQRDGPDPDNFNF